MITMMSDKHYNISYAPPVQVKDEPHRVLDTFGSASEKVEIASDDYGSVSVIGDTLEIESSELTPQDVAAVLA
jgi:hypothetical protein